MYSLTRLQIHSHAGNVFSRFFNKLFRTPVNTPLCKMNFALMVMACRQGLLHCLEHKCSLPPEVEEGNVEYKYRLKPDMSEQRLSQLTSQLQWRLTEHGECYYMIGYLRLVGLIG